MVAKLRGLSPADISRIGAEPAYLSAAISGAHPLATLELARSWHGLHYLLCGDAWDGPEPWKHAVLGGVEVGEDQGSGAARVLGPELVKRVAQALAAVSPAAMVAERFRPAEFEKADIYPGGWEFSDGWPRALEDDLVRLCAFYQERAAAADAVLISIA